MMNSSTISREALGSIANLGALYDAHTDTFCGRGLFVGGEIPSDAVTVTDTPHTKVEYVLTDKLDEKFDKLNVGGELKVSFLCGLISGSGSGSYLSESKTTNKEARATLVCQMKTQHEKLDLNSTLKLISSEAVDSLPTATHVVVAVQWGANATATVRATVDDAEDYKKMEAELKLQLGFLKFSVSGGGHGEYNTKTENRSHHYRINITEDALPDTEKLPNNIDEAADYFRRIPARIQKANGGRGVQVSYELFPLSSLQESIKAAASVDRLLCRVDEKIIFEITRVFDELDASQRSLADVCADIQDHYACLTDQQNQLVSERYREFQATKSQFRGNLSKQIVDARHGRVDNDKLYETIKEFDNSSAATTRVNEFLSSIIGIREKIAYIDRLKTDGVRYVGKGETFTMKVHKDNCKECIVFFASREIDDEQFEACDAYFTTLIFDSDKRSCYFVDMDVASENQMKKVNRVQYFKGGQFTCDDMLAEHVKQLEMPLARGPMKFVGYRPNRRTDLTLRCPGSHGGQQNQCDATEWEWLCASCFQRIEYGFDAGLFYCDCGSGDPQQFSFRCGDHKHGGEFKTFVEDSLRSHLSKLRPFPELNIMIMGETGVGKSTFINGFANYLTFDTLEKAKAGKQVCLIPTKFYVPDENFEERAISVGESKNECFEVGASATMHPRAYQFKTGRKIVNLIDTPGIGDYRGTEMDDQNFASILRFLANYRELHGIIILLKPNNARLTVVFKYCINELLVHLHNSAAKNIVFCFTNARGTFYRPGDTLPPLRKHLKEVHEKQAVDIVLSPKTVYCVDNEAFRFLCCLHNGLTFSEDDHRNYSESWTKSWSVTQNLMDHVEMLEPHQVDATLTMNEARRLIQTLTKPLADISSLIQQNVENLNAGKEQIKRHEGRAKDLKEKLQVPHLELKPIPIDYPRTVCTSSKCVDVRRIRNTDQNQIKYKTICHSHCYLTNVLPEKVPQVELQNCEAMTDLKCRNCGCPWDKHMHIRYLQETETVMLEDPGVRDAINKHLSDKELVQRSLDAYENTKKEYQQEQEQINQISARFGSYLKQNAILVYNDVIEDYLGLNIKQKEDIDASVRDNELIKRLKHQLQQYKEAKRILDERVKGGKDKVQLNEVKQMQKQLYGLKHVGNNIRKLVEAEEQGQKQHHSQFNVHVYNHQQRKEPPSYYHHQVAPSYYGQQQPNQDSMWQRSKRYVRSWFY